MKDCIFCKIITGQIPAKIIVETDDIIVFLDLKNHPLVVTKKHIANIYGLDDLLGAQVMKQAIRLARACKKGLEADGVSIFQNNEPAAGQEVMHYHLHVKPRWHKDKVMINMPDAAADEAKREDIVSKIMAALAQNHHGF